MLVYWGKDGESRFCVYAFSDINPGGLNGSTGQYRSSDLTGCSSRLYYRSRDYRSDELQACGAWHEGSGNALHGQAHRL